LDAFQKQYPGKPLPQLLKYMEMESAKTEAPTYSRENAPAATLNFQSNDLKLPMFSNASRLRFAQLMNANEGRNQKVALRSIIRRIPEELLSSEAYTQFNNTLGESDKSAQSVARVLDGMIQIQRAARDAASAPSRTPTV
jgi:hypothetical protein